MSDYSDEERDIIYASLNSYADGMEERAKKSVYGFYASDNDRVVKAIFWEAEHMRHLAKYIKEKGDLNNDL